MTDVVEIGHSELDRWLAVAGTVKEMGTPASMQAWQQEAEDMIWLLATEGGEDVAAAIGVVGWHATPGVGRAEVFVRQERRGQGLGSTLYAELMRWASERGCAQLESVVREDDQGSIAWAQRRGFREVRNGDNHHAEPGELVLRALLASAD